MIGIKKCPLCKCDEIDVVEKVLVKDISLLYKRMFGIATQHLFSQHTHIDFCRCQKCDLEFFDPMICGDQNFYSHLNDLPWYYFDDKPEFEYAKGYINHADRVLEIGAGKGAFGKKVSKSNYVGLEFSDNAIEIAKSNGIQIVKESIQKYSKNHVNEFDYVCSFQVLEHVDATHDFLASAIAALRVGGIFVVSVPSSNSFGRFVSNSCLDLPPHHVTRWSDDSLKSIAKIFNLEVVDIHHEKLQEDHKLFYASTIFSTAISKFFGVQFKYVDLSIRSRLIGKASRLLARIFTSGLINSDLYAPGLSVVAVYKKL